MNNARKPKGAASAKWVVGMGIMMLLLSIFAAVMIYTMPELGRLRVPLMIGVLFQGVIWLVYSNGLAAAIHNTLIMVQAQQGHEPEPADDTGSGIVWGLIGIALVGGIIWLVALFFGIA